ncbi:hypothetical protein AHA02nite_00920 [Alkalibacillus haloalkaliphilus]|uniref:Uncharacterized protein n=1 Tax=Alkalibacillus haloalkaliphilus TaxID=94136 RepID=A0A511VZU4_9BACI|nr:hypothetical protein AHA02nite_00920 [Alkalibacillus haloalkaliphilus]
MHKKTGLAKKLTLLFCPNKHDVLTPCLVFILQRNSKKYNHKFNCSQFRQKNYFRTSFNSSVDNSQYCSLKSFKKSLNNALE